VLSLRSSGSFLTFNNKGVRPVLVFRPPPGVVVAIVDGQAQKGTTVAVEISAEGVGHCKISHQPLVQMKTVWVAEGTKHLARQPEACVERLLQ